MDNKPFNKYYVLRITSLHIKKSVDTSIRKTSYWYTSLILTFTLNTDILNLSNQLLISSDNYFDLFNERKWERKYIYV